MVGQRQGAGGAVSPATGMVAVPGGAAGLGQGVASDGMDTSALDKPATGYRPAGSRITREMLQKAMRT